MARQANPVKRIRVLFFAERRRPIRDPRPCSHGNHAGPWLMADRFGAIGGLGTCGACGDSVHRSQVRVVA